MSDSGRREELKARTFEFGEGQALVECTQLWAANCDALANHPEALRWRTIRRRCARRRRRWWDGGVSPPDWFRTDVTLSPPFKADGNRS